MASYLYLRVYNHLAVDQTGSDLLLEGTPKVLELYGDPFKENKSEAAGGHTLVKFRAKNSGQNLGLDERADLGAATDEASIRVRRHALLGGATVTDLQFGQTVGVVEMPSQPPPSRKTVTADWRLRNDEPGKLAFDDLLFVLFEHNGAPNDTLKHLVRRLLRNQPDPLNLPISLTVLGTAGEVAFDPETGRITLGTKSEVRFRAVFALEKPAWNAYPAVTALAGRPGTPSEQLVEFAQMGA